MCDRKDSTLQQPECDEPMFRVFESIIQYGHRLASEQGFEISEVDAVLFKICLALSFVPFKSRRQIVTTECSYVNLKYSAEGSGLMGARDKVTPNLETKGRDPLSHPATVPIN